MRRKEPNRLEQIRIARGITQVELQALCRRVNRKRGISIGTISGIEGGKRCRGITKTLIAKALKLPVTDIWPK